MPRMMSVIITMVMSMMMVMRSMMTMVFAGIMFLNRRTRDRSSFRAGRQRHDNDRTRGDRRGQPFGACCVDFMRSMVGWYERDGDNTGHKSGRNDRITHSDVHWVVLDGLVIWKVLAIDGQRE